MRGVPRIEDSRTDWLKKEGMRLHAGASPLLGLGCFLQQSDHFRIRRAKRIFGKLFFRNPADRVMFEFPRLIGGFGAEKRQVNGDIWVDV